jgi:valyl-tRNA synthetase
MSEISTRYNPAETEEKWYRHWESSGYFKSVPDDREPFTIVIPPPNVTGVLHMGHLLNNTIQDILIRKARMDGKNACWVPGTDHASIATEAKVVRWLREEFKLRKADISREEFMQYAYQWKDKYGGIILQQLRRLGASCDWDRTAFTMDPQYYQDCVRMFVDLYEKGKLYRGLRMVNWDPEALTVLSNEEVIYSEENAQLFHLHYRLEGGEEGVVIATQRPETIFADVAVAVNPKDERFAHLVGKKVLIPLINRAIPVIADDYVDIEFGTGALKITPAHDPNDYEIGQRHQLPVIDILTDNGYLNEACTFEPLIGKERFEARKAIKPLLEAAGVLVKIQDYQTKIGRSERTNCVVEPKLSLQWFVKMNDLGAPALRAVMEREIKFFPANFQNLYRNWMDNLRDWCISRQLWWGQRIPAWYLKAEANNKETAIFVAQSAAEALEKAKKATGNPHLTLEDLRQDEDVLDTWASSWLWPISVFNGFADPDGEINYYYPTNVLVTGWDIIFFWVARMIMAGYEYKGERPFQSVYFTGMVRDKNRRKMSKSLGNSPDSLALLDTYGADGVRFGLMSSAAAGGDLIFDAPFGADGTILNESALCELGRNFCNKMWNALRLVKGWKTIEKAESEEILRKNELAVRWMTEKFQQTLAQVEADFQSYRLSEALKSLHALIWDDFCSWYLEMIKPGFEQPIDRGTYTATLHLYGNLLKALHPFMPFITEELWHQLENRPAGEDICAQSYPAQIPSDQALIQQVESIKEVITKIREIRNQNQIKPKDPLEVCIQSSSSARQLFELTGAREMMEKMAVLSSLEFVETEPSNAKSFISGTDQYYVILNKQIDVEAERAKLTEELTYQQGFAASVEKKLSNEKFVSGAPAQVVENERKKLADANARIAMLEESLRKL